MPVNIWPIECRLQNTQKPSECQLHWQSGVLPGRQPASKRVSLIRRYRKLDKGS